MPRGAAVRNRSATKIKFCGAYSPPVVRPTGCPDCDGSDPDTFCPRGRFSEMSPPPLPDPQTITEEKPSRLDVLSYKPVCTSSVPDASKVLMVLRPAGSAKPILPSKWIADTGSTFDIVPVRECSKDVLSEKIKLKEAVDMHTVNGVCTVEEGLRIAVPTLEKELEFLLLPNSPPIISVGQRCMVDGYEFHWP